MRHGEHLALTAAQHGIWAGQQLDQSGVLYNVAECIELVGPVQVEFLAAAVRGGIDEAEALHLRVVAGEDGPSQSWEPEPNWSLPVLDLRRSNDPWRAARDWMHADLRRPLAPQRQNGLFRAALLVASDERVFLYIALHHIALDGFGFSLLARRIAQLYTAAVRGLQRPPRDFGSFADVVADDLRYRASSQLQEDQAFWLRRLANAAPPPSLSARSAFPSQTPIRHMTTLPLALREALSRIAQGVRGHWGDALLAAFAGYLHAETSADEVSIGLPMNGRMGSVALRVPSMIMNIVPFVLPVSGRGSFLEHVTAAATELRTLRPHARYRYEGLRRDLNLVGGTRRLFGPVLNVMPFELGLHFAGLQAVAHNVAAGPAEDLALNVRVRSGGSEVTLALDANPACYEASELAVHAQRFLEFLERVVANPGEPLTPRPRSAKSSTVAGPVESEPLKSAAQDVVAAFLRRAEEVPRKIALEEGTRLTTYAELALDARRIAGQLREAGAREDSLVAMMLPRGADAISTMLGVLMVGASYVPLDPEGPSARTASILADARPALLVTSEAYREWVPELPGTIVFVEAARRSIPLASQQISAAGDAYVIYTSGSTGRPNGVVVGRTALAHFVAAATQRYGWSSSERVLQFAPLQFDASVEEIFLTLCSGGTLIVRSEEMMQSLPRFLEACRQRELTLLDLPTAFWHELVYALSVGGVELPPSLRTVIIGGEAALPERVTLWRTVTRPGIRLFNTYGPTETTVVATSADLSELDVMAGEPVPIGVPLPGVGVAIVDGSGGLTDAGPGELCVFGPTVATSYLRQPELDTKRFFVLSQLPGQPRAYRTGDIVRRRADGQLLFFGRVDDQLKISGQRVDPSEVETVLLRHGSVREVAVVAHELAHGSKRLVAHVVTAEPAPSAAELRAHAQSALLGAAVPSAFLFTTQLPRTSSGKIDRAELRRRSVDARAADPVESGNPLERRILRIWREVLGDDEISLHDDFFDRGGQSLQTIQVASRLGAELGREVPVNLVFRHPTVAELAQALADPTSTPQTKPYAQAGDDAVLSAEIWPAAASAKADAVPRAVLLTGATGFVGAQLLHALLTETQARVICLVRASSAREAESRVREALLAQGLPSASSGRLEAVAADLVLGRFGLDESLFRGLAETCDAVFHAAAAVSLVRGYSSLRASNAVGTHEILRFACAERTKPLHHVSTLAVAARAGNGAVEEEFVPMPPPGRDGYMLSKWVAERLVEQAIGRGLPASVYRLGRVVGAPETGFVNVQDIVFRLLLAGVPNGVLPAIDVVEPWTPVDFVARAIVALSREPRAGQVYHLAPAPPVHLRQIFSWVAEYGYRIDLCPLDEFRARLKATANPDSEATLAFFDVQAGPSAAPMRMDEVRSGNLERALAGKGLRCPSIDRDVVYRYLDFCVAKGLLPRPVR
ncbi:non-ribosomal peptide synthetase [Hyalangium versicolor]|uniref:non-ribosomal peptide synthetase n=1 Tax=Hyalangium versicolor TaxID=2861190 RepID=UPI001CCC62E3|nr:non-ribosomal peptide synthetase [Hyalangium versicolor]